VLSSGPSITLPVRHSRSCNALAFNHIDPHYLAVGLDKVRGESSLIIWDLHTLIPSIALPLVNSLDASILNSESRPQPQIPRIENQTRIDTRILQQHAPTEIVSSLAFLPSSTHLLLAGISHRWLRLFDLRSPSIPSVNVASKVHGIATDPFDPHRIACFGDASITVWDARKLNQPTLTFSERDALADGARIRPGSVYANIEFSSTRRGCLATLEKDSSYVRFWDIAESRIHGIDDSQTGGSDGDKSSRESSRAARRSWAANLPWPTGGERQNPSPKETSVDIPSQQSSVLADTRRSEHHTKRLAHKLINSSEILYSCSLLVCSCSQH